MRTIGSNEIERIEAEIEILATLSARQRDERWRELFGGERPPRLYGPLLLGVLAYRLQEHAFGGIKPATRRLLRQVAGLQSERRSLDALTRTHLKAGAVLLREWHGTIHRVTVVGNGYRYRGQHFRSLSEIARQITGSRWSGPRFFGLKQEQTDAAA